MHVFHDLDARTRDVEESTAFPGDQGRSLEVRESGIGAYLSLYSHLEVLYVTYLLIQCSTSKLLVMNSPLQPFTTQPFLQHDTSLVLGQPESRRPNHRRIAPTRRLEILSVNKLQHFIFHRASFLERVTPQRRFDLAPHLLHFFIHSLTHAYSTLGQCLAKYTIARGAIQHTNFLKAPNISLHPNPIIRILLHKRQPHLNRLSIPILNLNQPPQRLPLKILLTLLVDEMAHRYSPSFGNSGQGHGSVGGETKVVGGAHAEVGEEFQVADAVGAQLEIADWEADGGFAAQGTKVDCLDGARGSHVGGVDLGFSEFLFLFFL